MSNTDDFCIENCSMEYCCVYEADDQHEPGSEYPVCAGCKEDSQFKDAARERSKDFTGFGVRDSSNYEYYLGVLNEKADAYVPVDDPVDPDHYKFPSGVEVIDLSRFLTSNGGQALQYIARSTRLDGVHKGNRIEDLSKAVVFIYNEIARLEEQEEQGAAK